MAKPIVVVYLPENFTLYGSDNASFELMRILNGNYGEKSDNPHVSYPNYWMEYYWFCFPKLNIDAPEFEVFYEKDFTEVKFQELKKIVEDAMKSNSEPPKE